MINSVTDVVSKITAKTGIVRVNFDVPLKSAKVLDTTRIEASLGTLKFLIKNNCRLILLAHQDRPKGHFNQDASLVPIIPILSQFLSQKVNFIPYESDYQKIQIDNPQLISLVDNLRFWPQEEINDPAFAKFFSQKADFYVNEAFADSHREHASIVGISKNLPAYAGIGLAKEVSVLQKVTQNPKNPLVIIIGGSKLETKEPLVTKFASSAQFILVGGKLAVDLDSKRQRLPSNVMLADLTPDKLDITPQSAQKFAKIILSAGTVIWNGTMGVFENQARQLGTKIVAQAVNQTPAFTLVGGGDTETALTQLKLEAGIDHICTGGGAMLQYLLNGSLVGLKVLHYD